MEIYKNVWDTQGSGQYQKDGEIYQEGALDETLATFNFVNSNNEPVTYQNLINSNIIKYRNYNISQAGFYMGVAGAGSYSNKSNIKLVNSDSSTIYNPGDYSGRYLYLIIIPTLTSIVLYLYYAGEKADVKLSNAFSLPDFDLSECFIPLIENYSLFNSNPTLMMYGSASDTYAPLSLYLDYGNGINNSKYTYNNSDNLPCELIQSNSTNWQFANYNSNTCILTKVPARNNFLNDLYYIVTSPFTKFPGTYRTTQTTVYYEPHIFSFSGRTFYNFFSNYAVELPN